MLSAAVLYGAPGLLLYALLQDRGLDRIAGLGLGFFIVPAGFILRKRNRRKKTTVKQD